MSSVDDTSNGRKAKDKNKSIFGLLSSVAGSALKEVGKQIEKQTQAYDAKGEFFDTMPKRKMLDSGGGPNQMGELGEPGHAGQTYGASFGVDKHVT